ncbi:MAG: outer membrane protein assembly factor, partial [Terriglobus roseus]|nr:outer membrane protein assembly factor [Terriglobus roseus]
MGRGTAWQAGSRAVTVSRCGAAVLAFLLPLATAHAQDTQQSPSNASAGSTQQGAAPVPQAATPSGQRNTTVPGQPSSPAPGANSPLNSTSPVDQQRAEQAQATAQAAKAASSLYGLRGQRIAAIRFDGVKFQNEEAIPGQLGFKAGDTLDPTKVRAATRKLYLTGRYRDIQVRTEQGTNGLTIVFAGVPRYFVGRVVIEGVKSGRLASILEYATQLQPGLPFVQSDVAAGEQGIQQSLAQSGYYEPRIRSRTLRREDGHQVDITYNVLVGRRAVVGDVSISGDPGLSVQKFRDVAKLNTKNTTLKFFHSKNRVTRDTVGTGLQKLRSYYQKHDRLEAAIALQKSQYAKDRGQLDYSFLDHQGPTVKIVIEGAKVSKARQKQLLPIYEEGTVDQDLLNEGAHNIREFLARQGYFDAEVDTSVKPEIGNNEVAPDGTLLPPPSNINQVVSFDARPGKRYKVAAVNIHGNKYFETQTIRERLSIAKADPFNRFGKFSPVLLSNDKDSITSLYRANGFEKVQIEAKETKSNLNGKYAYITVDVNITEGPQQKFGKVSISGVSPQRQQQMQQLLT